MIAIISAFRNSECYVERYFEQMDDLRKAIQDFHQNLFILAGYGDSQDHTQALLHENAMCRLYNTRLVDVSHGGPSFGSVVHPERFKNLAYVGNTLWQQIPEEADYVALVESDLIWRANVFVELLVNLSREDTDMVAPMVYDSKGNFYDTWAFRQRGAHFTAREPYFPVFSKGPIKYGRIENVDSVGSFFVMKADLARQLTWPEKDVVVGLCKQVTDLGKKISVNKNFGVYHP